MFIRVQVHILHQVISHHHLRRQVIKATSTTNTHLLLLLLRHLNTLTTTTMTTTMDHVVPFSEAVWAHFVAVAFSKSVVAVASRQCSIYHQ